MSKRKSPLRVYRTAVGFHDAYVAAPSQKAALQAWGTDKDLFARGVAEVVTDPKLTAEPLAAPGTVIKLSRGDLAEQLAADRRLQRSAPRAKPPPPAKPAAPPRRKPKPRPSRADLDAAEAALADFEAEAKREIAAFRRREAELRKEREEAVRRHQAQGDKLRDRVDKAEARYEQAMDRWRASD